MKSKTLISTVILAASMISCGGGYSEKDYLSIDKDGEGTLATIEREGKQNAGYLFIDEDFAPKTRAFDMMYHFINGYAYARNSNKDTRDSIFFVDKNYKELSMNDVTDVLFYNSEPLITTEGNVWVIKEDGKSRMIHIEDGKELNEGIGAELIIEQVLSNGNMVMRRPLKGGLHPIWDYALYSSNGQAIKPFGTLTFIGDYSNGLARYSTNGYAQAKYMHESQKASTLVNHYGTTENDRDLTIGYMDEDGNIVISEQYCNASDFDENGVAAVGYETRGANPNRFYINRNNQRVDPNGNPK